MVGKGEIACYNVFHSYVSSVRQKAVSVLVLMMSDNATKLITLSSLNILFGDIHLGNQQSAWKDCY